MDKNINILVLIESLNINDSSGTKGRVAFLKSFIKAGYKVTALHYTQKEIHIEGINCVAVTEKKQSAHFLLSRIQRLSYRWLKKDIGRYVDTVFGFSFGFFNDVNSFSQALKKYNPKDYEMIWTFGKGTSFRPHAALIKNPEWHQKWYAYVHDPYPQHLYPRPYNFVEYGYKKKRYFFREITLKAHRMVFPSLLLKDWMQSYFTAIKDKSLVIPHQLATIEYSENDIPCFFKIKKFNLLHAGNLLDLRDPAPIVEAFIKFLEEIPEAKNNAMLYFIGKASIFHKYLTNKEAQISQLYISDGYVDFKHVYAMQQNASVNIILEAKSEISPFLPGKFPHCVAANKPILLVGPYYSECKRLLGNDYAYQFDFDEVALITNAIKELYENWKFGNTELNRPDLINYLESENLEEIIATDKVL